MRGRDWIEKVKAGLPGIYKNPGQILADRRLTDAWRIELLEAWPAEDDFTRARCQVLAQEVRERMPA